MGWVGEGDKGQLETAQTPITAVCAGVYCAYATKTHTGARENRANGSVAPPVTIQPPFRVSGGTPAASSPSILVVCSSISLCPCNVCWVCTKTVRVCVWVVPSLTPSLSVCLSFSLFLCVPVSLCPVSLRHCVCVCVCVCRPMRVCWL